MTPKPLTTDQVGVMLTALSWYKNHIEKELDEVSQTNVRELRIERIRKIEEVTKEVVKLRGGSFVSPR